MLTRLEIAGFRAFHRLTMDGLTRVNLVVGRNNSGKTSVLEAVELLARGGDPRSLLNVLERRGEWVSFDKDERSVPSPRHLFHGHAMGIGSRFEITGTDSKGHRGVACDVALKRVPEGEDQDLRTPLFDLEPPPEALTPMSLRVRATPSERQVAVDLSPTTGGLTRWRSLYGGWADADAPPVQVLLTDGRWTEDLSGLWDQVTLTPREDDVLRLLQVIHPDVERLSFTSGGPQHKRSDPAVFLKLRSQDQRVPLGTMGDGLKRLLGLGLHAVQAGGGYLLVDEIDTGLHHSTLERAWALLTEAARRLDFQVFATTHSWDCVRALGWLVEDRPELASLVSLHRVDVSEETTTRYSGEEVLNAARHEIEVRG